tara:strand:+ start:235 stop:711 length:477 start_codon:yes stop_codon:yes gene_type:complete
MNDKSRKAMFAKKHNASSVVTNPKERYVWYDHSKALSNSKFENLKSIPKNAPESIKYCSRCGKSHDSGQSKGNRGMFSSPLCNGCHAKKLKPLGHPPHWVWNKMSLKDKESALKKTKESIVYDPKNPNKLKISSHDDYDLLPYRVRQKLRHEWGIEKE